MVQNLLAGGLQGRVLPFYWHGVEHPTRVLTKIAVVIEYTKIARSRSHREVVLSSLRPERGKGADRHVRVTCENRRVGLRYR